MKNYLIGLVSCLSLANAPTALAVDIQWSGYGSIIAGKVLNGDVDASRGDGTDVEFVADFYDVGIYDEDISFTPETMLALQANTTLTDKLRLTAQLVAKGVDDFQPEFDWYYLTYDVSPEWQLKVGRRNIPMYYFSEYMEVGFAYPWIRPPSNLYWWQITQFNGITASYNFFFNDGEYANTLNVFYGNERSPENAELTYYLDIGFYGLPRNLRAGTAVRTDESWKNIVGANWHMSGDWFELRASVFKFRIERDVHFVDNVPGSNFYDPTKGETGITSGEINQNFFGLGGQLNFDPLTILFDYNLVFRDEHPGTEYPSFLLSAVYTMGDYQPYISYSKTDQDDPDDVAFFDEASGRTIETDDREEHAMISIGLRYNFSDTAAFKIQYDDWIDDGETVGGWNFHGDASAISMGVDFIF